MSQSTPFPAYIHKKLETIKKKGGVLTYSDQTYTYVMLATGERPTGGYRIEVMQANFEKNNTEAIQIISREIVPDPGDFVTQALTYPTAIYRLPKTERPIEVIWQ